MCLNDCVRRGWRHKQRRDTELADLFARTVACGRCRTDHAGGRHGSEAGGRVLFVSKFLLAAGYYASKIGGVIEEIKTLAEYWNGSEWAIQPSSNATGEKYSELLDISCTSSIPCTAAGKATPGAVGAPVLLVERYE